MAYLENIQSPNYTSEPSLRIIRRLLNVPVDLAEKLKQEIFDSGISRRSAHFYLYVGAHTVLLYPKETLNLFKVAGKEPTYEALDGLGTNLQKRLSDHLPERVLVDVRPVKPQVEIVKRDRTRGESGLINRYLYQTATSEQLAEDRQIIQSSLYEYFGIDDPASLDQAAIWENSDYDVLNVASTKGKEFGLTMGTTLTRTALLPDIIILGRPNIEELKV